MLKKFIIAVFILSILLPFTSCTKKEFPVMPSVTVKQKDVQMETIAKDIFDQYLKQYKARSVAERNRLKDYKINKITIGGNDAEGFGFAAEYAVLGVTKDTSWAIGAGSLKDNGWVEGLTMFVTVEKKDNKYQMADYEAISD